MNYWNCKDHGNNINQVINYTRNSLEVKMRFYASFVHKKRLNVLSDLLALDSQIKFRSFSMAKNVFLNQIKFRGFSMAKNQLVNQINFRSFSMAKNVLLNQIKFKGFSMAKNFSLPIVVTTVEAKNTALLIVHLSPSLLDIVLCIFDNVCDILLISAFVILATILLTSASAFMAETLR